MKKYKKTLIWTIVVVLIIIGGMLLVKSAKKREAELPPAKSYAIVVSVIKPEIQNIQLTLPSLALTQNDKDVKLASRVSGRVEWIKVSGSKVLKNEIIARIDNTSIQAGIKSVEAQIEAQETTLKNLEATHQRTLDLLKVEGASIEQSQMEESKIAGLKSKIESLKLKLNDLKNTLTYAIIRSPVNGVISKTMVNKGDMALPGRPVAGISAENGFYLMVRVPDNLKISGVLMDGKKYDAIPLNSTFNGLSEYKVYTGARNMTTGNRVEVDVIVFDGEAVKLPFDAVLNRNGKNYVLVVDGDRATPREINIIQSGENGIAVSNNDLAGEEIVVAKQDILLKLSSGVLLKVKEG